MEVFEEVKGIDYLDMDNQYLFYRGREANRSKIIQFHKLTLLFWNKFYTIVNKSWCGLNKFIGGFTDNIYV